MHARNAKHNRPEEYCPVCLWRTLHRDGSLTPCPKHRRTRRESLLSVVAAYLRTGLTAFATADLLFARAAEATGEAGTYLTEAAHLALVEARRRAQDGRTREHREVA